MPEIVTRNTKASELTYQQGDEQIANPIQGISINTSLTSAHNRETLIVTSAVSLTIPTSASLDSTLDATAGGDVVGFFVNIFNNSTGTVTIDAKTNTQILDGRTNVDSYLLPGEAVTLFYDPASSEYFTLALRTLDADGVNMLYNSAFDLWQRGTTFSSSTVPANTNGTYMPDRWVVLMEAANAINIIKDTSVKTDNSRQSLKLQITAVVDQKFGVFQALEARDITSLIGRYVTASLQARRSGAGNGPVGYRFAIISWSGTEDTVAIDPVSSWQPVDTNPLLAAGWTYVSTPGSTRTLTTSFVKAAVTGLVPDTCKNLGVLIWSEDKSTVQNDFLSICEVKLERGVMATNFSRKGAGFDEELASCQRYYEKSYNTYVIPGTAAATNGQISIDMAAANTIVYDLNTRFAVTKRGTPDIVWYAPASGAIDSINDTVTGDITVNSTSEKGHCSTGYPVCAVNVDTGRVIAHWTADAELK